MAGYIRLPVGAITAEDLLADMLDALAAAFPGWVPNDNDLEVWLASIAARMHAETRLLMQVVGDDIYDDFGKSLIGLQPIIAQKATVNSTWTMINNQGYTVDAGTLVGIRRSGDELVPFEVVTTFTVAPGSTATAAGAVALRAVDAGEDANGLLAGTAELIDSLAFVSSVVTTGTTAGGVDAEDSTDYRNRLREELLLLTPRPILAEDFAVMARRVAGVHRALGIDGYNPDTATYNNERYVTVAVVAEDGTDLSPATKAAVLTLLDAERELNFVVKVIGPTYTTVNVAFTHTTLDGFTPATVTAAAEAAVAEFLNPANFAGGSEDPPVWNSGENKVRYLELAHVLYGVAGIDDVTALTLNGSAADVTLAGVAPLPAVGTIDGTAA